MAQGRAWLDLVHATVKLHKEAHGDKPCLRGDVAAELSALAYPHHTSFRGLVVTQRPLRFAEALEGFPKGEVMCVAVCPEGFGEDAWRVTGGVLVPVDEPLEAGSVVVIKGDLLDPASYRIATRGLLLRPCQVSVEVGVRR